MKYIYKLKTDIEKHSQRYLWVSIVFFVVLFVALAAKRYYYFDYNIGDLAIFNQTFYNTLHGTWFANTITLNNYLADHLSLGILILLPIYAIKQSALTLLVIQVVITFLCAWPIYLISKKISSNNFFAYLTALCWLLNPFVHRAALYEFHMLHLAVFLFFWAFYFYQQNKFKEYLIFVILALLCREDFAFLIFGFLALSLLEKKGWKWVISSAVLPMVYFFIAISIIKKISPSDDYKYLIYYQWLGGDTIIQILWQWLTHPIEVLVHIFAPSNLWYLFILFLPFLFLPIFSARYLFFSFLPLMQFFLSEYGLELIHLSIHYVFLFLPGVFIAFIYSLHKINKKKEFFLSRFIYNNLIFSKIIFVFTLVYFFYTLSPLRYIVGKEYSSDHHRERQAIVDLLPAQASVVADASLLSSLSRRDQVYNINYTYFNKSQFALRDFNLPNVDYIYLDLTQFIVVLQESRGSDILRSRGEPLLMPDKWRDLLDQYNLILADNEILLWQNKNLQTQKALPFYQLYKSDKLDQTVINSWQVAVINEQKVLKIKYNKLTRNNYLIRLYQDGSYWEIPFDYGLYSKKISDDNQGIELYYYLDTKVNAFEIFSYDGGNALGNMGEAVPNIKRDLAWEKTSM